MPNDPSLPAERGDWLRPSWPMAGVGALMSTRRGGFSPAPYDSMNLRHGLGDDAAAVLRNQALFAQVLGATPVHLNQVHGARVVELGRADALRGAPVHDADASVTAEPGIACVVQVADCLPVLFASQDGAAVGAAHAGWRGLAAGVLEATLAQVCAAARCRPDQVHAWLGACIGPRQFQVGVDVLQAFGAPTDGSPTPRFVAQGADKWLADLPGLAGDRLRRAGVRGLSGGTWCTVEDASRFFSFRRDRITGRMAAAVWIDRRAGG